MDNKILKFDLSPKDIRIKNILNKVTHKNTNIVFHRTNYDVVDQSEASTIDNCKVISNNIE